MHPARPPHPGTTLGLDLAAGAPASGVYHPETFMLDNGMQVVVIPNRRAPVVAHWVWYKVGTADSPPGKSGLPHFLEHLMFKGSGAIPPGEFSKIVARHGGNDNAMTSNDSTAYFQMIAKDRLQLVMAMEADRMVNLDLSDEHVYPERDVILEERRSRVDNEPSALLGEQLMAAQYLHHPYRLPVIGWFHEIAGYTREDAVDLYRLYYAPNNAILIVAGDTTAAELRPLAERIYGPIAPRPVAPRHRLVEPPQHAERRVVLHHERVRQPTLIRSWLAPSFTSEGRQHAYALEVLAEILGGGGTSRLFRAVVVEQGLAAGAGAAYQGTSLDATTFKVYASPRPEADMAELERAVGREVDRILADGVTADELARTRRRLLAEAVFARDSLAGAAYAFGSALTAGEQVADVEAWPARIAAVTVAEIHAAARHVLRPEQSVAAVLLPAAEPDRGAVPC
jgi:zinc protease